MSYTDYYIYNFHYHLIWVTKYRHQTFVSSDLRQEMKNILQQVAEKHDIILEKMEVMPDHIHLLISFSPKQSASSVVKILKGSSSFLFMKKHPEIRKKQYWSNHLWSPSYYMSTLGNMSKETVEQYINNQIHKL